MRVSIRSLLAAGLSLTAVSASVPWAAAQSSVTASVAPEIRLSAAVSPLLPSVEAAAVSEYTPASTPAPFAVLADEPAIGGFASAGDVIINAYNAIEPWVAWGFELVQWGMSFVPILWWVAPGVDLAYFTIEPVVQSLVYSFAYLIDGNFSLIGPTIQAGLQEAAYNFVQYSIYWFESIIPFPPLPPWPPFPFSAAATTGPAAVTRAAATVAVESAESGSDAAAPAVEVGPDAEGDAAATTAATTEVTDVPEETQPEVTEALTETAVPTAPRAGKRTAIRAAREASAEPAAPGATAGAADAASAAAPAPADEQDQSSTGRSGGKAGASTARSGR
ncbi:MAG: hypothetical protein QG655_3524 [Actinomycetota bacterium]|nr:hypothetical protein [Actinomycetota bacterium]HPY25432.1 hypothetical protein [Mycobacterium sp.]